MISEFFRKELRKLLACVNLHDGGVGLFGNDLADLPVGSRIRIACDAEPFFWGAFGAFSTWFMRVAAKRSVALAKGKPFPNAFPDHDDPTRFPFKRGGQDVEPLIELISFFRHANFNVHGWIFLEDPSLSAPKVCPSAHCSTEQITTVQINFVFLKADIITELFLFETKCEYSTMQLFTIYLIRFATRRKASHAESTCAPKSFVRSLERCVARPHLISFLNLPFSDVLYLYYAHDYGCNVVYLCS